MIIYHEPKNTFKINEIYAFISQDENGEGIIGAPIGGSTMPLIGADKDRVDSLRPIARALAKLTNKKIKLIKMTLREDLEVIE